MTLVCGGKEVVYWQITYSGDDSGVKLDISSGVGTAHAHTAKEREGEKKLMIQYTFHFLFVYQ